MEIKTFKTPEINKELFNNYINSFNKVFKKSYNVSYFKKKYLLSPLKFSFHSFLIVNKKICGACTIIPYKYNLSSKVKLIGLAVDTFILEDYRKKNPFILYNLYNTIKKEIIINNLTCVVSVPNDNAFNYWIKINKFKYIGDLQYNVFITNPIFFLKLNFKIIKKLFYDFNFLINKLLSSLSTDELNNKINIRKHNNFLYHRYRHNQIIYTNKDFFCSFALDNVKGLDFLYLIDFYDKKNDCKNIKSLLFAIKKSKEFNVDFILYIGKLNFLQFLFLRIPKIFHIRSLKFIIDIIDKKYEKDLMDINNWDFGLLNFDVR